MHSPSEKPTDDGVIYVAPPVLGQSRLTRFLDLPWQYRGEDTAAAATIRKRCPYQPRKYLCRLKF